MRSQPKDERQWVTTAAASWTIALDNISDIPGWLSDTLCKACTGEGYLARSLYTNDDVTVLAFRRAVALTTIDAGPLAGDLAERLVTIDLDPIPPNRRRTEADILAAATAARPVVLGALCDLVARVLAALPHVQLHELPRMADWTRILAALDTVTGWTTHADYLDAVTDTTRAVLDTSPLAAAIRDLTLKHAGTWTGSATDLHRAITPNPPPKGWPASPGALSGKLNRLGATLRSSGLDIQTGQHGGSAGGGKTITLRVLHGSRDTRRHTRHPKSSENSDASDAYDALPP